MSIYRSPSNMEINIFIYFDWVEARKTKDPCVAIVLMYIEIELHEEARNNMWFQEAMLKVNREH